MVTPMPDDARASEGTQFQPLRPLSPLGRLPSNGSNEPDSTSDLFAGAALEPEMPARERVVAPSLSPRTGGNGNGHAKILFELDAVPAKEVLRNKAAVCPPITAFCEIIDNIFDNHAEAGSASPLAIQVEFLESGTIRIRENSGGVSRPKLEPLVRLGVPHHVAPGTIGSWGEGLKVALFSLGKEVEIHTWARGEQPLTVRFPPDWLDSSSWLVPVYAGSEHVREGETCFIISKLNRPIDWNVLDRELALTYGHKLTEMAATKIPVAIQIRLGGTPIEVEPRVLATDDVIASKFAFPPHFEPRVFTTAWQGTRGRVTVRVVVGLTPKQNGETTGVYLYGNGRLFARGVRGRAVGYGQSGASPLRDHPSCWRLHSYVFLSAEDGRDIPWQAPLKDGISENHPIAAKLRETLRAILSPYARFTRIARASEVLPYSEEWNAMDERQRADTIFEKTRNDAIDRYRELPRAFHRFRPPSSLREVDYETDEAKELLESLDAQARYVRRIITERDVQNDLSVEESLRALDPDAFGLKVKPAVALTPKPPTRHKITFTASQRNLKKLREIFQTDNDARAIQAAILHAIKEHKTPGRRKR